MPRADGLQVQGLIAETSILRLEIREVAARRKPTGPLFQDILAHVDLGIFSITVLFGFMASWTEFVLAWTFLTDPNRFTLAMGLNGMVGQYSSNTPWSDFAAMAILITIPVLILFFLLQRWILSGLAVGAVKG